MARRGPEDLHTEATQVKSGRPRGHHLDRAACQAKCGGPHGRFANPSGKRLDRGQQEACWKLFCNAHNSSAQTHSKPPRRHSSANCTKMIAIKPNMAISPNQASSLKAIAHGYKKTTSMSKMMNVIATR